MPASRSPLHRLVAIAAVLAAASLACNLPTLSPPPPTETESPIPAQPTAMPDPTEAPTATIDQPPSPSPLPTSTPLYLSGGESVELGANLCFDLDEGVELACSDPKADVQFEVIETASTAQWAVIALGNTLVRSLGIAYQSQDPPPKADCAFPSGTHDELALLPMAETFWNCFQTGEGRLGWLKTHSWVPGTLIFSWQTFSPPP